MRKATLVLATSVAFLLFGVSTSYAGTKKSVQMPSASSVANGSGVPVKSGTSLSIPGALQGEFIPGDSGLKSTPFKVLPTIDFSLGRLINQTKGHLKGGVASLVVGGVIAGMIEGLDWVMTDGVISKPVDPPNAPLSQYRWEVQTPSGKAGDVAALSEGPSFAKNWFCSAYSLTDCQSGSLYQWDSTQWRLQVTGVRPNNGSVLDTTFYFYEKGECPEGFIKTNNSCIQSGSTSYEPISPSDFDLIDAYVNAQSSEWLRDLLRESCDGALSPGRCYEDLKDNVSLSGPSTVNGPSSISTTTGPGGTTTKETKTTFAITYGSDYFVYAPTTTTTTVNPDGTTEVETEEPPPEEEPSEEIDAAIGDPYAPVVDKYNDIAGGVGDLEGNMSFINYGPWYSFGGACSPITLNLPVMGVYTIDHCPYVVDWIRPTLGFLFAVWTWLHCFSLWRETVQNARPI